jgi:hypothetical protein
MVSKAMETVTRVDAPRDVSLRSQLLEIIEDFCTNRQRGTRPEDVFSARPWADEDNTRYHFRLKDLQNFLEKHNYRGLSRAQLTQRIRDLGGGTQFHNIKGRGVNLWWLPYKSLDATPDVPPPPLQEDPI